MIRCAIYEVTLDVVWTNGESETITFNETFGQPPTTDFIASMMKRGKFIELKDGRWFNPSQIRTYIYLQHRIVWDWC